MEWSSHSATMVIKSGARNAQKSGNLFNREQLAYGAVLRLVQILLQMKLLGLG